MSKCLAIKTGENTLEPTAQTNNTLNAIKLALLQKQAMQGLGFNTKEYITESGTYTAPVTGVYRITAIAGGSGSRFVESNKAAYAGMSGNRITEFVNLNKGDIIPVTIGAGGTGMLSNEPSSLWVGGHTIFGDISTADVNNPNLTTYPYCTWGFGQLDVSFRLAYGPNAKLPIWTTDGNNDGVNFGGGAGVSYSSNPALSNRVGNGFQGCVIVEYFDPEKASLPTINDTDLIPYLTLLQRLDNLEKVVSENLMWNDEITITESGNFEVPYDGYYEVTLINGGSGGSALPTQYHAVDGGASGAIKRETVYLNKGDIIPVTIGAGGQGAVDAHGSSGGITSFGDISAEGNESRFTMVETATFGATSQYRTVNATGAGYGGGRAIAPSTTLTQTENNARNNAVGHLGGGGGACIVFTGEYAVGDGAQGSVHLRFHNPNKNQGV